jgi:DUF2075 family protein
MTPSDIHWVGFNNVEITDWAALDHRNTNWPVVYVLDDADSSVSEAKSKGKGLKDVYVGESRNAEARIRQHLVSADKKHLRNVHVVVDATFNKSVCLDLESYLIRMLAGDGACKVLNRNGGIVDADYYDRELYRENFSEIFERLRGEGVFTRSIPEIENSDLFKLSPFKELTQDQAIAVEGILEGLFEDRKAGKSGTIVVQGDPGTGKTVVGIYLLKLVADIKAGAPAEEVDSDSMFSEFFNDGHSALAADLKFGLVVPQQSLRESIKRVFKKTPGLNPDMVMTAFDVGMADEHFDLLVVDESHRLNQRANQASAAQNTRFREINEKLFGQDDPSKTQLDWIHAKSTNQILLLDAAQSVRPADLPPEVLHDLVTEAKGADRHHPLLSQMRVRAGSDYVAYVRRILGPSDAAEGQAQAATFGDYDFRMFDDIADMHAEILHREVEVGLSRLVAGYAWPWNSKVDKSAYDIEIDGSKFRWNSTQRDWIASPKSREEVGSIHTVQGYDLNYAGVIIGPDLCYDADARRIVFNRASYFDMKGKENNPRLGKVYTDVDLLQFVRNIYAVLLTRGIRGTYVYVCNPGLREYLRAFIPISGE